MIDERSESTGLGHAAPGPGPIAGPERPRILMYHAVERVAEDPNRICVSPGRFEAQMRYLNRRGLCGVSVRELLRAEAAGRAGGLVGITFDDAYENFLQNAVPILQRFGFSATVFAVGGMLGSDNTWDDRPRMRLLDAEGVREAAGKGMEVGSHGMAHIRLAGLDPEALEEEVVASRRVLGEVLDEEVEGFCYPYGSVDEAAIRAARRAGYSYACACWMRVDGGIHDLPRPPVWEMDGPLLLAAKLNLFPLYFGITGHSAQKLVYEAGKLAHGGTRYLQRRQSGR